MQGISKRVFVNLVKFVLLTAWIVFVCLVTIVFYGPDVNEQDDMAWGCFFAARDKQLGVTLEDISHTYVHKSGARTCDQRPGRCPHPVAHARLRA